MSLTTTVKASVDSDFMNSGVERAKSAPRRLGRISPASMGLEGVREAVGRNKGMQLTALLHHITPQLLAQSFYALRRDAAAGWTACRGENIKKVFLSGYVAVPHIGRRTAPRPLRGS